MKKILILQMRPEDEAADSEFEAILRVGRLTQDEVHRIRLEQGIPTIDINDYSAIIAGGSPFDVSAVEENKGQAQKDIEAFYIRLFDQVVPADFPFLGACSGNGLLGNYCGAVISKKYNEPIGSVEVTVTKEGMKDPLLKGLPRTFSALVGHKEACDDVPPGTVLLVLSQPCPVQMFRVKKNIYAVQFHPEADADEFVLRIKTYKNHGYFAPEEADGLIKAVRQAQAPVPKEILWRFVQRYK
ncbi:glutamine amidotransferase [Allomuricauda sp. SCSIO 65647]|uniref:glutamine amidotransferase n=1 Tax=Allomuricauda sp. SCSIO 65647 TaxID=2908843 RepID=UPI001F3F5019|nr:glutamine amidotransferase [Muricauda sp. SCSIO 65647]UJH67346.1 glutamine amidotransferase [Muricauda sp. SCSIO 65647]